MTTHYLRRMMEKFVAEGIDACISVTEPDGTEIPLITLNKAAQETVLYNFYEWLSIQEMMVGKRQKVVN